MLLSHPTKLSYIYVLYSYVSNILLPPLTSPSHPFARVVTGDGDMEAWRPQACKEGGAAGDEEEAGAVTSGSGSTLVTG
jgi:hypothetical protein